MALSRIHLPGAGSFNKRDDIAGREYNAADVPMSSCGKCTRPRTSLRLTRLRLRQ
jgi:hypothetical protein